MTSKIPYLSFLLIIGLAFSGCTTRYIVHDKGLLPANEVSSLKIDEGVFVSKIDGQHDKSCKEGYSCRSTWANKRIYELLPGDHVFSVYWADTALDNQTVFSSGIQEISFKAEPGKDYFLKKEFSGSFLGFIFPGSKVSYHIKEISKK